MSKYIIIAGMAIAAMALITGCSDSIDIEEARIVAADFMRAFDNKSPDDIRAMCTPELIGEVDSLDYIDQLADIHEKLGPYRSSRMLSSREKEGKSGDKQIIMQFSVTYAYYPATETIAVTRTADDSLKIGGHTISSDALLE